MEVIILETEGKVLTVNGSKAVVEIKRKSACSGNCVDCSGCTEQSMHAEVYTELSVKPGDWVCVSSEPKSALFGLFVLFILPLFLPAAVYLLTANSGFGGLFAAIAAVAAVLLIWLLSKSRWFLERTKPKVVSIIAERGKS